jgi:hypothetical protein
MTAIHDIGDVAQAIQLAVAPVFLLSSIILLLNVLTSRLGRVIDRARVLEALLAGGSPAKGAPLFRELEALVKRAKLIDLAITLSTTTSLIICAVIATLFIGAFWHFDIDMTVMVLFISAMVTLVLSLLCFLREILIATLNLVIGLPES